jgi:hypothetical protein
MVRSQRELAAGNKRLPLCLGIHQPKAILTWIVGRSSGQRRPELKLLKPAEYVDEAVEETMVGMQADASSNFGLPLPLEQHARIGPFRIHTLQKRHSLSAVPFCGGIEEALLNSMLLARQLLNSRVGFVSCHSSNVGQESE